MANLVRRVLAALVLIPLVVGVFLIGAPYSNFLLLLVVLVMAWEWSHLVLPEAVPMALHITFTSTAGLCFLSWVYTAPLTAGLVSGLAVAAGLILGRMNPKAIAGNAGTWLVLGLLYTVLPILAFQSIASRTDSGGLLAIWLLLVVWSTDTAAMAAGKTIGGPRLCPGISPNKTWAGLLGGAAFAGVVGMIAALFFSYERPLILLLIAMLLACVAQAGDLLESLVKRHFNAKDSGRLLPGHGGILDRVDGLVTASPFLLILLQWPVFEGWMTG
ncbi:phosphatidate cytidylyltransferase [Fodinicurvata fenggangensis]|uniref:phosphatidate cytidylyltransferase n=1 Tax=Fodinicurvata fenggangensis TaxID=1121830 RepID=UPI000551BA83|nr:phosphatidate cytidylyltransferase [Fodinicurvata fenggangensis]